MQPPQGSVGTRPALPPHAVPCAPEHKFPERAAHRLGRIGSQIAQILAARGLASAISSFCGGGVSFALGIIGNPLSARGFASRLSPIKPTTGARAAPCQTRMFTKTTKTTTTVTTTVTQNGSNAAPTTTTRTVRETVFSPLNKETTESATMSAPTSKLIAAVDQGTSSSRVILFDKAATVFSVCQKEVEQINKNPGWCQMDPLAIMDSIDVCSRAVVVPAGGEIAAVGVTNQRETTVVWDSKTGLPLADAVVWLDIRTRDTVAKLVEKTPSKDKNHFQKICGLPLSTYFSAVKLRWLLDNDKSVQEAHEAGRLMFGTVDSWVIYNLTGGIDGGVHVTDVTNASRTMLMNLKTLQWDAEMIEFFGFEKVLLPEIKKSSEVYGYVKRGPFAGLPISGCVGDQQAALLGQRCTNPGDLKNTYGTGCFMLFNTGEEAVIPTPESGLLATVAYHLADESPKYALEGSIAIAGAAVRWLRDNLGLIKEASEVGELASMVENTGGVYFVTAFSGLYAPYWRDDARGCIVGLTQYSNKSHIARATLESVCWQTKDIVDMINKSSATPLRRLKVDGGLTASDLCMQIQADVLDIPVERPTMAETTAFGAAIAAAIGCGVWTKDELFGHGVGNVKVFQSNIGDIERQERFAGWKVAVEKSFGSA
ncbi:hypothetical protein BC830DRAFT_1153297 [Chytriomyces sp. MP71]|nr:hypothetical protein BC830DRAFT_1153297 [Chytriomyces sp. MP71]